MARPRSTPMHPADDRLAVASAILKALGEGGKLQGEFAFDLVDRTTEFYGGDYYVSDLDIGLTHDRKRIVARLKKVNSRSRSLVVEREATFVDYTEFDTRFIHYFQIKPHNVLLKVEARTGRLDWEGEYPTPIYGHIHFYGDAEELKMQFDSIVKINVKDAANFSIRHLQAALSQLGEAERDTAAKRLFSRLSKASSS